MHSLNFICVCSFIPEGNIFVIHCDRFLCLCGCMLSYSIGIGLARRVFARRLKLKAKLYTNSAKPLQVSLGMCLSALARKHQLEIRSTLPSS